MAKKEFSPAGLLPPDWQLLETQQTSESCWVAFCVHNSEKKYGLIPFWGIGEHKRRGGTITFTETFDKAAASALKRFANGTYDSARRKRTKPPDPTSAQPAPPYAPTVMQRGYRWKENLEFDAKARRTKTIRRPRSKPDSA
jgi:hypothetical protein